jgi:hypothetical protein
LRSFVFVLVSVLCLVAPLSALDRWPQRPLSDSAGPIMEARVYFDDVRTLRRLGDLAGELDICTWVKDKLGGYLVINTDAAQLERIRAAGLLVDVTYADIRQKFYEMTGVRPGDIDAGRDFGYFLTYYEMQDTLEKLAANFPTVCVRTTLGLTFQGREMWCLKISDNAGTTENEPAVFINAASHAREPLGTSTCVGFATKLLSEYGHYSVSTWLVNNREIYIVPVMNPDGYVYNSDSGGAESNWRKNRRGPVPPNIGIDLNRNYGYRWGYDNQGSSSRPQNETYRGPARFSEVETQLVRDFLAQFQPHNCMDFHTFGQYNMYPWGYDDDVPPDQAVLEEAVDTFQANNHYPMGQTGQVYSTIYPCNGLSVDWEYSDTAGKFVTYAYTCELGTDDFWYGWNDSNYIRSEVDLNIPNVYYLTRLAGVYFENVSVTVDDSIGGNSNGQLDPGELSGIWFTVRDRHHGPALTRQRRGHGTRLESRVPDCAPPEFGQRPCDPVPRAGVGQHPSGQPCTYATGTELHRCRSYIHPAGELRGNHRLGPGGGGRVARSPVSIAPDRNSESGSRPGELQHCAGRCCRSPRHLLT